VILVVGVVAYLFLAQQRRESVLNEQLTKAVADSTRFAAVMKERARLEARRDSALIQLGIIRAIDEDRYIWPHIMDEVSRALPPYTWLRQVTFTGTPQGTSPAAATVKSPPIDTSGKLQTRKRPEPVIPRDSVRIAILGRTVDIQALTRFMRNLEES